MDYTNIIIAACTVVATVISIVKIIGKKFDKIDGRFNKVDGRFDKIDYELKDLNTRVSRIEGFLMGPIPMTGTENKEKK